MHHKYSYIGLWSGCYASQVLVYWTLIRVLRITSTRILDSDQGATHHKCSYIGLWSRCYVSQVLVYWTLIRVLSITSTRILDSDQGATHYKYSYIGLWSGCYASQVLVYWTLIRVLRITSTRILDSDQGTTHHKYLYIGLWSGSYASQVLVYWTLIRVLCIYKYSYIGLWSGCYASQILVYWTLIKVYFRVCENGLLKHFILQVFLCSTVKCKCKFLGLSGFEFPKFPILLKTITPPKKWSLAKANPSHSYFSLFTVYVMIWFDTALRGFNFLYFVHFTQFELVQRHFIVKSDAIMLDKTKTNIENCDS